MNEAEIKAAKAEFDEWDGLALEDQLYCIFLKGNDKPGLCKSIVEWVTGKWPLDLSTNAEGKKEPSHHRMMQFRRAMTKANAYN